MEPTINKTDNSQKTHTLFQIAATGALKTNCRETHTGPPLPPSLTHFNRKFKSHVKMKAQENEWWTKWFGTQRFLAFTANR